MSSLLNLVLIISGTVFALFALDAYRRWGMNFVHFLVFGWWGVLVVSSILNPQLLDKVANTFGISQWGMAVAYLAIIFLAYMSLQMMHKITKDNHEFGRLNTAIALQNTSIDQVKISLLSQNQSTVEWTNILKNKFVFMIKWYNEEWMISKVIDEIIWAWYSKLLFINDGSTDNTLSIIKDKEKEYSDLWIYDISHLINRRHWWWNKTWIEFFRKFWNQLDVDWVVFFDSDGQMDIGDIPNFAKVIQQNPDIDIIQGSRFIEWWQASNIPLLRKVILWWAKMITYIFNGRVSTDSHNGYKVFRLSALQKIKLFTDTTSYANELIDEYTRLNLKYTETPVHIRYTDYSMWWRWQSNGNAINILIELIYKKFFYR